MSSSSRKPGLGQAGEPTAPAGGPSADGEASGQAGRTVIVPRRPGLLRDYEAAPQRPRDELDDFIDELFGSTTEEKPGWFDAGLVVVGLVLVAWYALLGGPGLSMWLGVAAFVLGLALPARAALRRYGWSRTGGLRRRIVSGGQLLDASHPATVALIEAYSHLVQMSCLQGTGDSRRVVSAGHMALVEVATHLEGRPPDSPAKARFVNVRTEAIEALARQMMRAHDRWAAQVALDDGLVRGSEHGSVDTSPWASLDALNRSGAISELEKLNAQLRRLGADEPG